MVFRKASRRRWLNLEDGREILERQNEERAGTAKVLRIRPHENVLDTDKDLV